MTVAERLEAEVAVIVLSGEGYVCPEHRMPAWICMMLYELIWVLRRFHCGAPPPACGELELLLGRLDQPEESHPLDEYICEHVDEDLAP